MWNIIYISSFCYYAFYGQFCKNLCELPWTHRYPGQDKCQQLFSFSGVSHAKQFSYDKIKFLSFIWRIVRSRMMWAGHLV